MAKSLLSLNPPRKTSPKNSGCGKPPAQGRQSTKHSFFSCLSSLSPFFFQLPPIVWEQRGNPCLWLLTLEIKDGFQLGGNCWGLQPPISSRYWQVLFFSDGQTRLSWSNEPFQPIVFETVFTRGPCWSNEYTAGMFSIDFDSGAMREKLLRARVGPVKLLLLT